MFSALKVKGKKLYEFARQGITVERKKKNNRTFNRSAGYKGKISLISESAVPAEHI